MILKELDYEDPSFDNCIIGKTEDGRLIYCLELMLLELFEFDGMSIDECMSYINDKFIKGGSYYDTPIIVSDVFGLCDNTDDLYESIDNLYT